MFVKEVKIFFEELFTSGFECDIIKPSKSERTLVLQYVFLNYYKKFKCINKKCRHNCCIGWEIDIDDDTLRLYDSITGYMGKRFKENISRKGVPHFILSDGERCPFLNSDNLCDIILSSGEDSLCTICKEHPRFHNSLPGRIESGLGLCCEEAARIIIGQSEPALLEISGEYECDDEIIALRDKVITLLQNREIPVSQRIDCMLDTLNTTFPEKSIEEWCKIFLSLENLDIKWRELLELLQGEYKSITFPGFDSHMASRESEYEQLTVYIIYRYFANSFDISEASVVASFTALCYRLVYTLGALIFSKTGKFDFEDQLELIRLFSSEIEYSTDNVEALFGLLSK